MPTDVRLVATVSAVSQEDTGEGTPRAAPRGRDGVWDAQLATKGRKVGQYLNQPAVLARTGLVHARVSANVEASGSLDHSITPAADPPQRGQRHNALGARRPRSGQWGHVEVARLPRAEVSRSSSGKGHNTSLTKAADDHSTAPNTLGLRNVASMNFSCLLNLETTNALALWLVSTAWTPWRPPLCPASETAPSYFLPCSNDGISARGTTLVESAQCVSLPRAGRREIYHALGRSTGRERVLARVHRSWSQQPDVPCPRAVGQSHFGRLRPRIHHLTEAPYRAASLERVAHC
ncbi:hypothetical protein Purlil1_12482 [Purpureocillium lilacinum]|uniref:Uncharacterized protein n=1 Tax=Purpureocillium lilacinum TaxID=33203 RepID=A0ABR0BGS8_PURLI|nr:hypothetical protein Purlil1_12482 [Purpureocillium lilacinum]